MSQQFWQKFEFGKKEFDDLREVIYNLTGIVLKENKKEMLYSRLSKRLRQLQFKNFGQYLDLLQTDQQSELGHLVNAVTTNLTRFFREDHHYVHMHKEVLPKLSAEMQRDSSQELMVWSAGCSSGMEAYSAAMVIHEYLPKSLHDRVKILATDIDTNMLNTGANGIYTAENRETIPKKFHSLTRSVTKERKQYQIVPSVKNMVHFKYLNLLQAWPIKKKFDIIFCRNVMIYFDRQTRDTLIDRYINQLKPDGILYLGHAESLVRVDAKLKAMGHSIFQKIQ